MVDCKISCLVSLAIASSPCRGTPTLQREGKEMNDKQLFPGFHEPFHNLSLHQDEAPNAMHGYRTFVFQRFTCAFVIVEINYRNLRI